MNRMNHKEHEGNADSMGFVSLVSVVLFVLFMVPTPAQAQQAAPLVDNGAPGTRGNADTGRQTYTKKGCYACHGREGQGSPTTGPRLGPNPVPLATFTRYVRAPRGQMPPYSEKVASDAELADMYAFLQARPGPAPIESALSAK
jgi:mono/diheme cytochrome c family protein